MTWEEFKGVYPHLWETLEILRTDNGMKASDKIVPPPFLAPSLEIFENQASQLSNEEKETIALGDDDAREELIGRTGFEAFDDFLTEAFEGMLSDIFWQLPS
jgi:hypothetical protein